MIQSFLPKGSGARPRTFSDVVKAEYELFVLSSFLPPLSFLSRHCLLMGTLRGLPFAVIAMRGVHMLRRHVEIRIPLEIRRFNSSAGCSSLPGTLGKLVMVHDLMKREEQRDYDEFMGEDDEQYVPTCSTLKPCSLIDLLPVIEELKSKSLFCTKR